MGNKTNKFENYGKHMKSKRGANNAISASDLKKLVEEKNKK